MIRNRLRMLLALFVLMVAACGKEKSPAIESAAGLHKYGALPGLRTSHLQGLRDELARLESERATAAQLTDSRFTVPTTLSAGSEAIEPQKKAASLQAVFVQELQESLLKQLDELYPVGPFVFSPSAMRAAIQLKDRYDAQRQRIHQIIAELDRGFEIQLTQGLAADTSFTDVVTIGNRLDAIVAAELLSRDNPSGAAVILREMTAAIESLATEKHIVPRIAAVHRRGEALRVMEAIAMHPNATLETHRRLGTLIDDQLVSWPADQFAWIGDRAIGMQTYELVRDGYLLSILGHDEQSRLRREVGLDRLATQVAENVDQDELFYLRAMRQTIDACQRPYHQRERVFHEVNRKLASLRDSLAYPLVADLILWKNVQEGQRLQALDRARFEAWSIALAASVGAPRPAYNINPLTGRRYIIDPRPDKVIVDGIDPDRGASPIMIPRQNAVLNTKR
ncbi:MAG: hypothetical protein QGG09_17965 [Pirellulaceae bacterium]|nr:hypothetical protein [Pirellulaceae bacterium]HJN11778.1 hypothetical protein [Pirellulaceae bacterium]